MTRTDTNSDMIINRGGATIQHGPLNNRIYLMKQGDGDIGELLDFLNNLCQKHSYTKIFAKIPASKLDFFIDDGFKQEAHIPKFYKFSEDACFMAKYFSSERKNEPHIKKISEIMAVSRQKKAENVLSEPEESFVFTECVPEHAGLMAELYREVFKTYPFPIHNPDYILKTMKEHIKYYGIFHNNRLIALSSAEIDFENLNAEMTDFATHPDFRSQGLAFYLLKKMEKEMGKQGIKTFYTIARALSYGMNITFSKAGYVFSGTLINNTNICGSFESMNVWYKAAC